MEGGGGGGGGSLGEIWFKAARGHTSVKRRKLVCVALIALVWCYQCASKERCFLNRSSYLLYVLSLKLTNQWFSSTEGK